jgi:hypothetical protein
MLMAGNIQALLFPLDKYDLDDAFTWAFEHGFRPIKYHITVNYIRLRLMNPVRGARYRVVYLGNNIKAIMAY